MSALLVEVNTEEVIQEAGEDLLTLVGLTLEAKIVIDRIKTRLVN